MKKEFDYIIYIGRFQPFHIGHYEVAQTALKKSQNLIFVLGSHDRPRTAKNPFTTSERKEIIASAFTEAELERIHFVNQIDYLYNDDRWLTSIQASINAIVHRKWNAGPVKIGFIGFEKDHSSYYLSKFPFWHQILTYQQTAIDATEIREKIYSMFLNGNNSLYDILYPYQISDNYRGVVTDVICRKHKEITECAKEFEFINNYKKQWTNSPYPPTFLTADAVVTQSGHILLVERAAEPGKGLLALPGGFISQKERIKNAAIRELKEETKIDVPEAVLFGSIVKKETYDHPDRSSRGRTITEAFHIKLADREYLPKVKGSDDARFAKWYEMAKVKEMRSQFFEDHIDIIEDLVGI